MKRFAHAIVRPILSFLFVAVFCSFTGAVAAHATSASITVSGNEGAIPLSASATFTAYTHCDSAGNCWTVNSGTLRVYKDNSYIGGSSGNGSASWSTTLNGGTMSQGTHTFLAVATDSEGVTATSDASIVIDNTPEVSAVIGKTEGDMNVHGTVDFKDNIDGYEGNIYLYIQYNGIGSFSRYGYKFFEGAAPIDWTWQGVTSGKLNAGTMPQGNHILRVKATAANGAVKYKDCPFVIDNTPKPTILGTENFPDNTMDIFGTVLFKDNIAGYEGKISLYLAADAQSPSFSLVGSKSYEGKSIRWKYSDFTGSRLPLSTWGKREFLIKVVATAANGASATVIKNGMIPAAGGGCPYP